MDIEINAQELQSRLSLIEQRKNIVYDVIAAGNDALGKGVKSLLTMKNYTVIALFCVSLNKYFHYFCFLRSMPMLSSNCEF